MQIIQGSNAREAMPCPTIAAHWLAGKRRTFPSQPINVARSAMIKGKYFKYFQSSKNFKSFKSKKVSKKTRGISSAITPTATFAKR
jgi:hypothetical protein